MKIRLPISGEYPPDWKEIRDRVRSESGHRCIRCGHPYLVGEHGNGEWTPCDEHCVHVGPLALLGGDGKIDSITTEKKDSRSVQFWRSICDTRQVIAQWRILTVHHMDGNKSNCEWWNLLALCQRCHLQIQGKLNPEIPFFLEHSEWAKPYVPGFYAKKYRGLNLSRAEVMSQLDDLLLLERIA